MDYTVLARRFRPQSFGEVVGQESISQALRNAIAAGRVAHAYLFTGARGVGKTSTARILAKALNCPQAADGDPCNTCEICGNISVGADVDVLEIDGASNRGIDEIRDLRANVSVKPMRCRYKIYIIDEVHMLTTQAFNALLKTLEEPPPNVKFIFCTTEPDKVPDTILSRCQRFDFGVIATRAIRERLEEIARAEGVTVEPAALELVARRAAGSMRDSQSLFDQLLSFGGPQIGAADVHRLLGTAPDDRLEGLVAALVARERGRTLELFQQALSSGAQLSELTDQLLAYCRDLMVLAAGAAETPLMSVADERRPVLREQAGVWGLPSILAALQILSEAKGRMKGVTYGQVLAELALVRMASLEDLSHLAELVALLKSGKLSAGTVAMPHVARTLPPSATRVHPESGTSREPDLRGALQNAARTPAAREATSELVSTEAVVDSVADADGRQDQSVGPVTCIPWEVGNESAILAQLISNLSDMTRAHAKNVARAAILGPNQLVLTFPKSYHLSKQYFERSADQVRLLEAAAELAVGRPVRVTLELDQHLDASTPEKAVAKHREPLSRPVNDGAKDPLVQKVLAAFGGSVVRVDQGPAPASE